ncbi:MAG: hypothetical protein ACREFY_20790 [Acetobacteraceae bacterium]
MKLFTYFRSSAAWQVRIALGLKGLAWAPEFVHLLRDGGEQPHPAYRAKTPPDWCRPWKPTTAQPSRSRSPSSSGWRKRTPPRHRCRATR